MILITRHLYSRDFHFELSLSCVKQSYKHKRQPYLVKLRSNNLAFGKASQAICEAGDYGAI